MTPGGAGGFGEIHNAYGSGLCVPESMGSMYCRATNHLGRKFAFRSIFFIVLVVFSILVMYIDSIIILHAVNAANDNRPMLLAWAELQKSTGALTLGLV